jgi:hypothetical protein
VILVGYLGETVAFTAVGTDWRGEVVHGLKFTWEPSDPRKIIIDETGRAKFLEPGLAHIICRAGPVQETAAVLVRPGARPRQTDDEWINDQKTLDGISISSDQSRIAQGPSVQRSSFSLPASLVGLESAAFANVGRSVSRPSILDKLVPTVHAQSSGSGVDIGLAASVDAVGSPPRAILEQTRLGPVRPRTNFQFSIPIAGLGGRGLGVSLALHYNSDLWGSRFDPGLNMNMMTFDPIQSWPSPGFTLGLGRIAHYDWQPHPTYTGTYALMLIDPDGTRHYLGRAPQSQQATTETTDGTHMTARGACCSSGYRSSRPRSTTGLVRSGR